MSAAEKDAEGLAVQRVFMILEQLARNSGPMTLTEIASGLDLPKSSLLKLLRGMKELGYLVEDTVSKAYLPSSRICQISWHIENGLVGHNDSRAMLEDLRDLTGESVGIAIQQGLYVAFYSTLMGRKQLAFNLADGATYPIQLSAAGRCILSSLEKPELQSVLAKLEKADWVGGPPVNQSAFIAELAKIRRQRYATTRPDAVQSILSIAKLLPTSASGRAVAVSVGGMKEEMLERHDEILAIIDSVISRHY